VPALLHSSAATPVATVAAHGDDGNADDDAGWQPPDLFGFINIIVFLFTITMISFL